MVKCIYIVDMYHNIPYKISLSISDPVSFVKNKSKYQHPFRIYMYVFDDHSRFFSIFSPDHSSLVLPANNLVLRELFWHFYHPPQSQQQLITSIIDKLHIICSKSPLFADYHVNDAKLENFLASFASHPLNDQINHIFNQFADNPISNPIDPSYPSDLFDPSDPMFVQSGGFLCLIKWIEDFVCNRWSGVPCIIVTGFFILLEIIVALIAGIPGLQVVAGAGLIADAISILISILRCDLPGTIFGVISIIPVVEIFSGLAKISRAVLRLRPLIKFASAGSKILKHSSKLTKIFSKIAMHGDDFVRLVKFGAKYGDDVGDLVQLGSKYGDDFAISVRRAIDAHDTSALARRYGSNVAKKVRKLGNNAIDAVNAGIDYGFDALQATTAGSKGRESAVKAARKVVAESKDDIFDYVKDEAIDYIKDEATDYAKEEISSRFTGRSDDDSYDVPDDDSYDVSDDDYYESDNY